MKYKFTRTLRGHVSLTGIFFLLSLACEAGTISVTPLTADGGTVGLNVVSYQKLQYVIKNTGTANLTVTGVDSSSNEFHVDQPTGDKLPLVIPAGQSYTVVVSFRPTAPKTRTGNITITSDDTLTPLLTLKAVGYGGIEQNIRLAPGVPFEIELGQGVDLRANVTFDNGASGVALLNWTSSNTATVQVGSGSDSLAFGAPVPTGKVSSLGLGTSTVTVTGANNANAKASVNVTVVPSSSFEFMATTRDDRVLRVKNGAWGLCYDFPETGPDNLPSYRTNLIGVTTVNGKIANTYVTTQSVGTATPAEQIFYLTGCGQRITLFDAPESLISFRDIAVDSTGNAVASTNAGLWRLMLIPPISLPISSSGLPVNDVGALAFDNQDNFYAASYLRTATMQSTAIYVQLFGSSSGFPIAVLDPSVTSNLDILGMAIKTTDFTGVPFSPTTTSKIINPYVMTRSASSDRAVINRFIDLNGDGSFFKVVGSTIVIDPNEIAEVAVIDAGVGLTSDPRTSLIASVASTEGRAIVKLTDKNNDGDFKDADEYKVIFQSNPWAPLKDIAFAALCDKSPSAIINTLPPGGVGEIGATMYLLGGGSVSPCGDLLKYEWTDEDTVPPKPICTTATCAYTCTGQPALHKVGLKVTDSLGNNNKTSITIKCGPPALNGFWPGNGVTNTRVFLFGKNFQLASGENPVVCFNNGTNCAPIVQPLAPDLLFVLQPADTTTGKITVETAMGKATSLVYYNTVVPGLRINGVWPSEARRGRFVFVFGSGFSTVPGGIRITVNGAEAPLAQVLGSDILFFIVPYNAALGPGYVEITSNGTTVRFPIIILP